MIREDVQTLQVRAYEKARGIRSLIAYLCVHSTCMGALVFSQIDRLTCTCLLRSMFFKRGENSLWIAEQYALDLFNGSMAVGNAYQMYLDPQDCVSPYLAAHGGAITARPSYPDVNHTKNMDQASWFQSTANSPEQGGLSGPALLAEMSQASHLSNMLVALANGNSGLDLAYVGLAESHVMLAAPMQIYSAGYCTYHGTDAGTGEPFTGYDPTRRSLSTFNTSILSLCISLEL